jgi:hypothetical protein
MKFSEWLLNEAFEWAAKAEVPPEPGTIDIPANHVRLYTYTKFAGVGADEWHKAAESLRTKGLDIGMAKGSTYGEPNAVWASAEMPHQGKVFAEWSIDVKDERWLTSFRPQEDPRQWEKRKWDVYFLKSIRPEEIHCVHEPWHHHRRYLAEDAEMIQRTKAGEFDHLLDSDEYGPAVINIKSS